MDMANDIWSGSYAASSEAAGKSWSALSSYTRYLIITGALLVPFLLILFSLSLYLDPLRGDLVRLGGYTENRYGWNSPQGHFPQALVTYGTYDKPVDVIVIGDSFSNHRGDSQSHAGSYWPNFLANETGLSVAVLDFSQWGLPDLLEHPVFKETPPRLVVVESVERYLIRNFNSQVEHYVGQEAKNPETCRADADLPRTFPLMSTPIDAPLMLELRPERDWPELGQAGYYLRKRLIRAMLSADPSESSVLILKNVAPFSNARPDQLLVHMDELSKQHWSQAHIEEARCALITAQNLVQANGQTAFAFMPAPDKLTAYADFLSGEQLARMSLLDAFRTDPALHWVDTLTPLKTAITRGSIDVYLPNDTHWGVVGHRIAARTLITHLQNRGILATAPPARTLFEPVSDTLGHSIYR